MQDASLYAAIKDGLARSVPFVETVGIEITDVSPGAATALLCQREPISNHIGSVHAGALFTLGETASGAAMSGAFAANLLSIRPVAAGASIAYRKVATGVIAARATVNPPVDDLVSALEADGKVTFDVSVVMTDENSVTVAEMTVSWHVRKR
ncbi:MAG: DUF4442 domain-containing protein [Hyphomonadaceae bacterium]|nr:DUF4442 domain-containing protein [Hyphomonadaceae bacterium]